MCNRCNNWFLALVVVVFAFWQISFSKWIIIVAAGIIFLKEIFYLIQEGCECDSGMCIFKSRIGSEIMMEKSKDEIKPSREEVKQTLMKKKKKK